MLTANQILEKEKLFAEEYQRILTGFNDIDSRCDFLRRGQVSLLAARPAMGKTSFALNITANLLRSGKKVLYFSYDETSAALINKLLRIADLTSEMLNSLFVEDTCYSGYGLRKLIEKVNNECPDADLIIFDSVNPAVDWIQWLYKAFPDSATLIISTASRECENRADHHVMLSDVKDLNLFNSYVYAIGTIYRDDYYNEYGEDRTNIMQFSLLKGDKRNTFIPLKVKDNYRLATYRMTNSQEEEK